MRTLILSATLALALGGCNGSSAKPTAEPSPSPAAAKVADPAGATGAAGPGLALGEATVYELGPPEQAVMKLHADGHLELAWRTKTKEEWMAGGVLRADGAIEANGEKVMRVVEGPRDLNDHGDRMTVTGTTILFHMPGLADVTAELVGNTIKLSGDRHDGMGDRWRIEAADPAVVRTAFLVFGPSIAPVID